MVSKVKLYNIYANGEFVGVLPDRRDGYFSYQSALDWAIKLYGSLFKGKKIIVVEDLTVEDLTHAL